MLNFPEGWRFDAADRATAFRQAHLSKARQLVTRSGGRGRGRFPTSKASAPQPYESQLELQAMRVLELASSVQTFTSQPARMRLADAPALKYTPDLAAVLNDGRQCLLEVKPARMFLEPRILARMTEVSLLYRQIGQELHFLLDSDLHPSPSHRTRLQDALYWSSRRRAFPRVVLAETEPAHGDEDAEIAELDRKSAGVKPLSPTEIAVVKAHCDHVLFQALDRSFEDTVEAAREAGWQELLA